jgi:hypothetical protein
VNVASAATIPTWLTTAQRILKNNSDELSNELEAALLAFVE